VPQTQTLPTPSSGTTALPNATYTPTMVPSHVLDGEPRLAVPAAACGEPAAGLDLLMFGSQMSPAASPRSPTRASTRATRSRSATGQRAPVGAVYFDAVEPVDAQGNIFIPNVGPIHVQGVRNADLTKEVEAQIKRTYKANVGVYATLLAAQPVKVYVTGFVRAPGLYPGLSSDSVLYYLDRAGGIDYERGTYLA
jgi:hypothetical protein